jgi:hypothetical protein
MSTGNWCPTPHQGSINYRTPLTRSHHSTLARSVASFQPSALAPGSPTESNAATEPLAMMPEVASDTLPIAPPTLLPQTLSHPWDDWNLDENFLRTLEDWEIKHPESTLVRILDSICVGIDTATPFFQLIPDNPFPARGIVGALAHLVQLGAVRTPTMLPTTMLNRGPVDYVKG